MGRSENSILYQLKYLCGAWSVSLRHVRRNVGHQSSCVYNLSIGVKYDRIVRNERMVAHPEQNGLVTIITKRCDVDNNA
jgi:hypothetical protein